MLLYEGLLSVARNAAYGCETIGLPARGADPVNFSRIETSLFPLGTSSLCIVCVSFLVLSFLERSRVTVGLRWERGRQEEGSENLGESAHLSDRDSGLCHSAKEGDTVMGFVNIFGKIEIISKNEPIKISKYVIENKPHCCLLFFFSRKCMCG